MLLSAGKGVLPQVWIRIRTTARSHTVTSPAVVRLLSSLAVLEQKNGKLQHSSLSAATAAHKVGGSIVGFVAGGGIKAVAEEASKIKGLDKVIMVENVAYDKV